MNVDLVNTLELMKKYISIPSPCGHTFDTIMEAKKDFEELGLSVKLTKKGSLIATLAGKNTINHIAIATNIDTYGSMVSEILDDGYLRFRPIGKFNSYPIDGENCYIITRKGEKIRGSIISESSIIKPLNTDCAPSSTINTESSFLIRLDEKISSKNDVLSLNINIGDFVAIDSRFEVTPSGFIKSRYINNKSGIAMLLEVCRYLKYYCLTPEYTVHFLISSKEGNGQNLLSKLPPQSEELVIVDTPHVKKGKASSEYSVTTAVKNKDCVYDLQLNNKLIRIADENAIDYAIDIVDSSNTYTSLSGLSELDIQLSSIGPGVSGYGNYERTHISSIENTIKLLIEYTLSK